MKIIIAGSRNINSYKLLERVIENSDFKNKITEIISGCAGGIDSLAILWAKKNGVAVKRFPANWSKYRKSAGIIRNREMAKYGEGLIAIWDGKSKGTKNMIENMRKIKKPVYLFIKESTIKTALKREEILEREEIMEQWDNWREYISRGGKSSWPRDAFEALLDYYDERIEQLEKELKKYVL